MKKNNKILITGGSGFIGSNFIRYMLNKYRNINIVNIDKLTYAGNKNNLKDIEKDKRYKFIKGDICDSKFIDKLFSAFSYQLSAVINLAAETHVDRSIRDSADFIRTNIEGTRVLLDAVKKHKIKKFLHVSTDEVYGDVKTGLSKESDKLLPNSPYAASKAAADLLCLSYSQTYKIPLIITRSSNNFGPYQYPEKVMPLFITNLLEGKKIPLYGDGKNIRDWVYVEDNCSAIDYVLKKGKIGRVYNIGGGNQIRNVDMAKNILKKFGLGAGYIEYVTDRPGHDRRYALSSVKVKQLGWRQKYDFNKALDLTINWYKKNSWWWKPIKKKADIISW